MAGVEHGLAMTTAATAAPAGFDYVDLMIRARTDEDMLALAVRFILSEFDAYYEEFSAIPRAAKGAFEAREPARSVALSRRRLALYGDSVNGTAARLKRVYPLLSRDEGLWEAIQTRYLPLVEGRYEEDLAVAYIHSVRRVIFDDGWRPVAYGLDEAGERPEAASPALVDCHAGPADAGMVARILEAAGFESPYADLGRDAALAAGRLASEIGPAVERVEMVRAGFYRNRGAYLVGRATLAGGGTRPVVLSLENSRDGIVVDAVLTREADVHNIFSTTLANFHVTETRYHELAAFLRTIMPRRPLGLHYSTIGFNHVGKVAVMQEIAREIARSGERIDTAVGFRGTVAIGFSAPSSSYVLKVIRDRPTAGYKWGAFPGVEAVLGRYRQVHEINRAGSMLDNVIYQRIRLPLAWFAPRLALEVLAAASGAVSLAGNHLVFRHLIVQQKLTPMPQYLAAAGPEAAEAAVVNLGHCIKNNAAAGIFNKDLDARNYGVSRYGKVFLFDYDAVEPLEAVKVRTNADREDGEEDVPDWFFEDGTVFLPEEIEAGLMLDDRRLRRAFRGAHADLLGVGYWQGMQRALARGWVPRIEVYPEYARLRPDA